MSKTQQQSSAITTRRSLQMKHFGNASLKGRLAWDPASGKPIPDPLHIGTVIGMVSNAEIKEGQAPDGSKTESALLHGEFIGIMRMKDDEVAHASEVYLPKAFANLAHNRFKLLEQGEQLEFTIEIYAVCVPSSATGYEYVVKTLSSVISERMERLLKFAIKSGAQLPPGLIAAANKDAVAINFHESSAVVEGATAGDTESKAVHEAAATVQHGEPVAHAGKREHKKT